MKKLILLLLPFSLSALARDVYVQGYMRNDGTYVAPHTRSAPDEYKWNNYGAPSTLDQQREEEVYDRDYDQDGINNQYDYDDDGDGLFDDYE